MASAFVARYPPTQEHADNGARESDPVRALVESHRLRVASKPLGIIRIDASAETILVQFEPEPPIDPLKIIDLVQSRDDVRFAGPDRFRVQIHTADFKARSATARELLRKLT